MRRVIRWVRRQIPGLLSGAVMALAIANGAPALVDRLIPDDPPDHQAGAPPILNPEVSVRDAASPFYSTLAGRPPGRKFQVVTELVNVGGSDASGVEIRTALASGLRMISGSCRIRTSDKATLQRCEDNFTNGGFSFRQFGRGSWIQVYFNAQIGRSVRPGDTYVVIASSDSAETEQSEDTATVAVGALGEAASVLGAPGSTK